MIRRPPRSTQSRSRGLGDVYKRQFQTIRLFSKSSVIDNIKIAYHFRMSYGNTDAFLHTHKYWQGEQLVDDYAIDLLRLFHLEGHANEISGSCLLYTSDAADDLLC